MTAKPFDPPYAADERTMLLAWLRYQRESCIAKLEGVSAEQALWKPAPGANSLHGIVNHLVYVEHWWFYECFAGNEAALPRYGDPDDRDFDFTPPDGQTPAQVVDLYRAECARSDEIARSASLDDVAKHRRGVERGVTMRWILVHMIEETARHAGHMDITRELIDGSTGML